MEKIFKEAHIQGGGTINAALPTQSVFSSIFTLPKMKKDEREKAIELQVQKMIATPISDLEVESRELGGMDSFDRIFFTAASLSFENSFITRLAMITLMLRHSCPISLPKP